jgi:hypothetical protein
MKKIHRRCRFSLSRPKTGLYSFVCPDQKVDLFFKKSPFSINSVKYTTIYENDVYVIERAVSAFDFISVSAGGFAVGEARIGINSEGWVFPEESYSVLASHPSCLSGRFLRLRLFKDMNPRPHAQWHRAGFFRAEGVLRSPARMFFVAIIVFCSVCEWDLSSG